MKLSIDNNYRQWGHCMANQEYARAIQHIEIVLQKAKEAGDCLVIGHLLRKIGRSYAAMGELELSFKSFEDSDIATGGDGRARLDIAKFWYEIHNRPDIALKWVRRILEKHEFMTAQENVVLIGQDDVVRAARGSIAALEEAIGLQNQ